MFPKSLNKALFDLEKQLGRSLHTADIGEFIAGWYGEKGAGEIYKKGVEARKSVG